MGEQSAWLQQALASGPLRLGQLVLWRLEPEGYGLCHARDCGAGEAVLESLGRAGDAREIAKYAEDGSYRALKGGRDLRGGWVLRVPSVKELVQAVDFIYPAALGQWLALENGRIRVVSLRETLGRQSGMYRQARRITDGGIARIVGSRCRAACLRRILWPEGRDEDREAVPGSGHIPLICSEACNLLVADAMALAQKEAESGEPGA